MSDLVLAVTHKHLVFNVLRSKLSSRSAQLAGSLLLSVTGILDVTGVAFGESPRSVAAVSAPAGREAVVLEGSVRGASGEPLMGSLSCLFSVPRASGDPVYVEDVVAYQPASVQSRVAYKRDRRSSWG